MSSPAPALPEGGEGEALGEREEDCESCCC